MSKIFLTEEEVARRYGLKVQTLRNWRFKRCGPAYRKFKSAVRYYEADLEAYEKSCRVQTEG